MGKASSSKKVARAARAGGRVSSGQPRSILFPGVITLVVLLGVSLVVYARADRRHDDQGGVPQLGQHIHEAIAFDICGSFQANIPEFETKVGIHTHGDGVLHIHPFSQLGVGANATLGRFLTNARDDGQLDVSLSNDKLTFLGTDTVEGETKCEGVTDPQLRVAYWTNVQDAESKPEVTTGDFNDLRLDQDGGGFTIFYGDSNADIPKPPNAAQLHDLGAQDGGQTPDTAGNTTTTAPGSPDTSSTVADPNATTTTVAADPNATTTTLAADPNATSTTLPG